MSEKQTSKERLKDITDSIEKGIQELFQSDKYAQYLRTMSRFHKYSVNNTMLIYMQRPDATLVAGFNKWRDQFERNVKKGEKGIKIIGVNYGTLGFLAECEKDEWEKVKEILVAMETGDCRVVKRTLLQIDVMGKTYYALNEVAIQRDYGFLSTKSTQILHLDIEVKEGRDTISGDGLLICTPTGSTAYSLSAGGAILTPEVPVFMMTPICAFSMRARPIVFSDNEVFNITVKKGKSIVLTDGGVVAALPEGAEIHIAKAPFTADFLVTKNSDFFARVRNKLNG
jgi:NAD kinase